MMITQKHKVCDPEEYTMLKETMDINLNNGYHITIHAFKDNKFHIDIHDDDNIDITVFTEKQGIREQCENESSGEFHYYTFKGEQ